MSTGNVSYIEPAYCIVLIFISYRYTFDNGYVGNQLSFWIAKSKAKEAALSGEVNLNMKEFLHTQQIKLIKIKDDVVESTLRYMASTGRSPSSLFGGGLETCFETATTF